MIKKEQFLMKSWICKLLKYLGRHVYGSFLGYQINPGAELYLEDLWRDAPWFVALTHTGLALLVMLLPLFIVGKFCLFSKLSQKNQEKMQQKMILSKFYFF